jgi:hypothetical protein
MRDKKDLIGDPLEPETAARFEAEAKEENGGHPIVATIVGVLFLLLIASQGRSEPFGPGLDTQAARMGYLFGSVAAGAGIVWGIAYAVTIRKASTKWKVASLIVIAIASLLSTAIKMGGRDAALVSDALDMTNQVQAMADSGKGPADIKFKAGSGPMSRMMAAMLNPLMADGAAFEKEMQAAGLVQVVSFEGLTRKSPVLDRCDGLDRLAERAKYYRSRLAQHMAAAFALGRQAVRAGEMPADALSGFEKGARDSSGNTDRHWELNQLSATEAAAICRILARRNWDKPGNELLFRNEADLAEFRRHGSRIDAYAVESEQIKARSRANVAEWTREIERLR